MQTKKSFGHKNSFFAMDQELNDSELDAIAGGMETIIVPGATPYLPRISVSLLNNLSSYSK